MSNEQKPSDADMALAREWAPSDPEWSLTVIAKRIARVRREARAEAFEEAAKASEDLAAANVAEDFEYRPFTAQGCHLSAEVCRALAAKERAQ